MKTTVFIIFIIIINFIFPSPAAANMRSPDFILQMPNFNFTSGNVGSTDFKLGYTGGQLAPGEYSSTGFILLAGFWYIKTIIPFTFTVSNQTVEFGVLSSGTPATATTTLTVSAGGAGGYQVTAQENHPPMAYAIGAKIPDTTGDNGEITESTAGEWNLNGTYGFGYTLYGNGVPTPFPTAAPAGNYFKQFSDISSNEEPEVVMSWPKVVRNHSATVTYKINISASQPAGRYHNVITYIATPTY